MIIKIKEHENPESWTFFGNVNRVTKLIHHNIDSDVLKNNSIVVRSDVYDFTNNPSSENDSKNGFLELWLYGKEKDDIKQVLCFRPAYLINDEGKTIEKF